MHEFITLLLWILLVPAPTGAFPDQALQGAKAPDTVTSDIEKVLASLPDSWNRRDPEAFASAFTEPHDYVAVGGRLFKSMSRQANAQAHDGLWKSVFQTSRIAFETQQIELIKPDVALAIVKCRNDYTQGEQAASHETIITAVLLKTPDGWRIRQFNNNLLGSPRPAE